MDGTGVRGDGKARGRTLLQCERVDHPARALHELIPDERRRDLEPAEAFGRWGDPTGRDPHGSPAGPGPGEPAGPEDEVDRGPRVAVFVARLRAGLEVDGLRPPVHEV